MRNSRARAGVRAVVAAAVMMAGCRSAELFKAYEYEEDLYLSLDGSGTMYVNASVPALVALRGIDLDLNPRERLDRNRVRAAFSSPVTRVTRITTSRKRGRLYVHLRLDVDDVRALAAVPAFTWSTYQFDRRGDLLVYQQTVGPAARRDVGNVGWNGDELVAFRMHLPSKVPYHNAGPLRRGNILVWEQTLSQRLAATPLFMEARMEPQSILYRTLWLFALCIIAVALTFAVIIWRVVRKGQTAVPTAASS